MNRLVLILLGFLTTVTAFAQPSGGKTIEGFWQDTARRILFSREAPPGYAYGQWIGLDPEQTYPTAKHIRRSGTAFELVDLLYDNDEAIKVLKASESSIEFTRTTRWSGCSVHHQCGLEQDQLLCSLRTSCPATSGERLVWQGEERYVRRASCERQQSGREAQGIPVRCR
jgi:hypothetical protein